ncbi:MAG: DUF4351 domain-containing protein [Cyanobacteriota bacterium]
MQQLLREELMRESITYQALVQESEQRGIQREAANLTLRLLRSKFGPLPEGLETYIRALPTGSLEDLSETLLTFGSWEDLTTWLGH